MERFVKKSLWGWLVLAIILLSACDSGSPSTNSTSTPTAGPTADQLGTLIAMQQKATRVPSATPWPSETPTYTPSPSETASPTPAPTDTFTPSATFEPTNTLTLAPTNAPPTPSPYPTNTPRGNQAIQVLVPPTLVMPTAVAMFMFDQTHEIQDHYWFARPFPRDPTNTIKDYASRSYPYGTSGDSELQTHYGLDIQNIAGTAVLAVGSGWVMYAGSDLDIQFGPRKDFYGNLVVIEHDLTAPDGRKLYTLYGHMRETSVETGQRVELQQKIGEVGSTGVALGAHLHLEVRIGDPHDYGSTYNPDLWIRPWAGYGTLAGRITDATGHRLYGMTINLLPLSGPDRYTFSYADDGPNSDPYYGEHFTYGDLPAGRYQVIVRKRGVLRFNGEVNIIDGQTSWIDIVLN
ncbi:MAG: peptidoglycan DD-metalloendopeptidase family protein [Chloroflexi bacterium]|nr:peptidoglycan DD-metalloendopeptidase family protein [Chloroflexota bacterium]